MGKRPKTEYHIAEFLATICESDNSDWGKFILRAEHSGGSTIDIRSVKAGPDQIVGKGVSLKDDEVDILTDNLLDLGYGSLSKLEKEYNKRQKMYGFKKTHKGIKVKLGG